MINNNPALLRFWLERMKTEHEVFSKENQRLICFQKEKLKRYYKYRFIKNSVLLITGACLFLFFILNVEGNIFPFILMFNCICVLLIFHFREYFTTLRKINNIKHILDETEHNVSGSHVFQSWFQQRSHCDFITCFAEPAIKNGFSEKDVEAVSQKISEEEGFNYAGLYDFLTYSLNSERMLSDTDKNKQDIPILDIMLALDTLPVKK